jgi:hypothetical protein
VVLAGAALAILPLPAFADDEASPTPTETPSPTPTVVIEVAAESPTPSTVEGAPGPTPTPTPTAEPTPTPTASAAPTPTPVPTPTPPATKVASVLLYRPGSVVRQYRSNWCVPAAAQTMKNLIRNQRSTTFRHQQVLYNQIRANNRYAYATSGNDVAGWAWALRHWTKQPYQARSFTTKTSAIAAMVAAIDRTRHPVGITVRHGTHAWVVLGYKARVQIDDPTKRTILGLYVSGPLGPGSSDPWPYRYVTLATFGKSYTKYHEWQRRVVWEGRYVIVAD